MATGDTLPEPVQSAPSANLPDLHAAVLRGNPYRVAELLASGANPSATDHLGRSPIVCALLCGADAPSLAPALLTAEPDGNDARWAVFEHILHATPPDTLNTPHGGELLRGTTPVGLAAYLGREAMLHALLDAAGADPNAPDEHGATPLMYAARDGRVLVARLLLECGATVLQCDRHGLTALDHGRANAQMLAVLEGALLEAAGVWHLLPPPCVQRMAREYPLLHASVIGCVTDAYVCGVNALLAAADDWRGCDAARFVADLQSLQTAVLQRDASAASALLRSAENPPQTTLVQRARARAVGAAPLNAHNVRAVQLVNHIDGATGRSALHALVREPLDAAAASMLDELLPHARPQLRSARSGWSLLHYLCRSGSAAADDEDTARACAAIDAALARGAAVDLLDWDGNTPLHVAALGPATPATAAVVRRLLAHGASAAAANSAGATPLGLVQSGSPAAALLEAALCESPVAALSCQSSSTSLGVSNISLTDDDVESPALSPAVLPEPAPRRPSRRAVPLVVDTGAVSRHARVRASIQAQFDPLCQPERHLAERCVSEPVGILDGFDGLDALAAVPATLGKVPPVALETPNRRPPELPVIENPAKDNKAGCAQKLGKLLVEVDSMLAALETPRTDDSPAAVFSPTFGSRKSRVDTLQEPPDNLLISTGMDELSPEERLQTCPRVPAAETLPVRALDLVGTLDGRGCALVPVVPSLLTIRTLDGALRNCGDAPRSTASADGPAAADPFRDGKGLQGERADGHNRTLDTLDMYADLARCNPSPSPSPNPTSLAAQRLLRRIKLLRATPSPSAESPSGGSLLTALRPRRHATSAVLW